MAELERHMDVPQERVLERPTTLMPGAIAPQAEAPDQTPVRPVGSRCP